ncbi:alpha beta-hydrolase [Lecanosticta acicola]|uniref:Alpha beta-hydrolase n=1 Tax=Lecanosticta acicola TaxID=111012 RepID=A0AAI8Z228_9PEZI|nr:alpha beta-hydrolase [Lecanosticta acicola]
MADEDLATRAPESDAQEDGKTEADSKPDQGAASMGGHCTTDRPTPADEQSTGELARLNDVEVYIAKPADYPHAGSKLLLLLTGGTGIHSTNNQLQADRFAAEGFLVVMPDQFGGDPVTSIIQTPTTPAEPNPTLIEQVKLGIASVAKSFSIDMWLARHTPEKVLPIVQRVIDAIREEFADAVAHGDGIYAVGYCFGAKYVLLLGSELHADVAAGQRSAETEAEEGMVKKRPFIKAGAIAHGTQITASDLENCKVPLSIAAVEDDSLFPDKIRETGIRKLKEKGIEHDHQVYSGVPHGFAVLGEYQESHIMEKQREAFRQMLSFLQQH